MNPISILGLLASSLLPATAPQARLATLARAQETFSEVDSDKDGKLSPAEVVSNLKLSTADARGVDADRDGFWSKDEFLVFYRQRLLAADVKPAADLEAEATRILAARKAKAGERSAERGLAEPRKGAQQAPPVGALSEAVDALEVKAIAGKTKGADFDRVRELLVAEARAADLAAKGEDQVLGEKSELHAELLKSLDRLRSSAAAGNVSREEYQAFRAALVRRFRHAANGPASGPGTAGSEDPNAEIRAIEQGLDEALDALEKRAVAGNASREDFERVRDQLVARARMAANHANAPGAAEIELQGPVHRKMMQSLERLQAAAAAGNFSREEYRALRESIVQRFRNSGQTENPGQPRAPVASAVPDDGALTRSVDDLGKRVEGGQVTPADFKKLRELIAGKAQAAAAKTDPDSANEALVYQKLVQSLDRLEKAAQNGSVDRQEFQAFKDTFLHRARQIANQSQQSNSASSTSASEQSSGGKRAGVPVSTPPAAQPLPADKGSAKRAGPAREAGSKESKDEPKPAPQPAPQSRPKPGEQEPEKPQAPPQRPPH